jgi:multiple sugar transport system ATP-binding protein
VTLIHVTTGRRAGQLMERAIRETPLSKILIEGLTRRFGRTTAVDGVNLEIGDGEFLVLLGPSGCGKTTLLRMIAGMLSPSEGRIMLDEKDITYQPPKNRDLAMVFQSYALYPHLSVERNIGFPLRVRRIGKAAAHAKVAAVADQLELGALLARKPKELSGGQRQRVALGRALVRDPKAFLMDEPLSNLDAKLRTATRTELTALHRRLGSTFVYVTHDQIEAMTMATRIALMNGGRLEQVGTPTEVYDRPSSTFVAGFLGSPPMNLVPARLEARAGWIHAWAQDIEAPLWPGESPAREIVLGIRPEHLKPARPDAAVDAPRLSVTVLSVENLGSEEVAHCAAGDRTIAMRGTRPLDVHPGDRLQLTAAVEHVHLFDRASGRRLLWQEERSPDTADSGAAAAHVVPPARRPDSLPARA